MDCEKSSLLKAGVLEDTVKASQLEILGLQHQVEALRYLMLLSLSL